MTGYQANKPRSPEEQAEWLLNAASDFIAATLAQPDPRAWDHLLIYAPRDAIERRLASLTQQHSQ